ncbi:MAG TPA: hypothetical protein VLB46_01535 [Pyrinomonadaceae bacterium]|nr:hypothetical protein [Pyrinomonadaceae bacterium]
MRYLILSSVIVAALTLHVAQPAYTIIGQVQDNTGKPACGVMVCALAEDFDPGKPNIFIPCAYSDPQGKFAIAVSNAGKYKLVYSDGGNGHWPTHFPFFRHPSAPLPEVMLGDDNVTASITISMLPRNGLLVGKSVDIKTGLPVESVEFILCHAANQEICWRTDAKNAGGNFTVPAPHVPFTLKIKANGFDDWLGPNGGPKESPITVAPETNSELSVFLNRTEASKGRAISETEKLSGVNLAAPVQLSPANDTVFDHYPRRTPLKWAPVEGAVSYTVEVDYCDGRYRTRPVCINPKPLKIRTNPATAGIVSTTYDFDFVGAQRGRWRVWALDIEGREGFKSPWRSFVYLQ